MKLLQFLFLKNTLPVIIAVVIGLISGITNAWLIALISDYLGAQEEASALPAAATYILVGILTLTTAIISEVILVRLAAGTAYRMRNHICRYILKTPLIELEQIGNPRFIAAFTTDIHAVTFAMLLLPALITNFTIIFACLAYLGHLSPMVFLALVVFLVLSLVTYFLSEKAGAYHLQKIREGIDMLMQRFEALTTGIKEIKLHRRRRQVFYEQHLHYWTQQLRYHDIRQGTTYAFSGNWVNMLYFVFIGLLLYLLPLFGEINIGTVTGFILVVLYIRGPITALVNAVPNFRGAMVSMAMLETMGLKLDQPQPPHTWQDDGPARLEPLHCLALNQVVHRFKHDSGERDFVLGPLDLEISRGELIFVIGGNGSGKTTFAKILTGLYQPLSGEILLNGKRVESTDLDDYRQYFSAIFAEFYVFDQILGLDYQDEDLDERARFYLKKLRLDDKVSIHQGKLSSTKLSTGQRKRLALLTAYLEDRPIYLFDEWAADQDPEFREVFYRQLLPELKQQGKTVLAISHDDRYFHLADRIIKLEDGKIETMAKQTDMALAKPLQETGSANTT